MGQTVATGQVCLQLILLDNSEQTEPMSAHALADQPIWASKSVNAILSTMPILRGVSEEGLPLGFDIPRHTGLWTEHWQSPGAKRKADGSGVDIILSLRQKGFDWSRQCGTAEYKGLTEPHTRLRISLPNDWSPSPQNYCMTAANITYIHKVWGIYITPYGQNRLYTPNYLFPAPHRDSLSLFVNSVLFWPPWNRMWFVTFHSSFSGMFHLSCLFALFQVRIRLCESWFIAPWAQLAPYVFGPP